MLNVIFQDINRLHLVLRRCLYEKLLDNIAANVLELLFHRSWRDTASQYNQVRDHIDQMTDLAKRTTFYADNKAKIEEAKLGRLYTSTGDVFDYLKQDRETRRPLNAAAHDHIL